jgi:hypothetical protein
MFVSALGVSSDMLKYAKEGQPDTQEMKIQRIFAYWLSKTENPTWELLCDRLDVHADYSTVIRKIREDHHIPDEAIGSAHDLEDYLSELVKFRPTMFVSALGVSSDMLKYAKEGQPDTQEMKIQRIFAYWLSKTENPTWELLCDRLDVHADYSTVIRKIREDHHIPDEDPSQFT